MATGDSTRGNQQHQIIAHSQTNPGNVVDHMDFSWPSLGDSQEYDEELQSHAHMAAASTCSSLNICCQTQSSTETRARKRINDRVYREKQKKGKEEMKSKLDMLSRERGFLRDENASLKKEKENMRYALETDAKVKDKLQYDLAQFRSHHGTQNLLLHVLSENFENHPDLRGENLRLEIENELLRKVAYEDGDQKMCPLVEEKQKLEVENSRLKVQNKVLCDKLVSHCLDCDRKKR